MYTCMTWFTTGRNEVVAKVIFLHLSVILFTGGGVCLSACWDTIPHPPGADTSPSRQPPSPPEQTPPPCSRHPPEHSPPRTRHPQGLSTPTPGTKYNPLGLSTPPREANSGIRSTSGQYASYWNAYLFYTEIHSQRVAPPPPASHLPLRGQTRLKTLFRWRAVITLNPRISTENKLEEHQCTYKGISIEKDALGELC